MVLFYVFYIFGGGLVIWVNGKVVFLFGFVIVLGDSDFGVYLEYIGSG